MIPYPIRYTEIEITRKSGQKCTEGILPDCLDVIDTVVVELTQPTRQELLYRRFEAYFGREPDVDDKRIAGEVVGLLDLLAAT